jgi:hypothetical protein
VLADLVRTDRHNHRPIAGDTELADALKLVARAHQSFIWGRQRHANRLRNALREHYPQALEAFGTELAERDAVAVLRVAPMPELGRPAVPLQDHQCAEAGGPRAQRGGARRGHPGRPAQPPAAGRRPRSPATAFALNGVTFLISALLLLLVRARSKASEESRDEPFISRLTAGFSAIAHSADVAMLMAAIFAATILYGLESVLLVVVSEERLGTGPDGVGWLFAAMRMGGLLGAGLSSRLGATPRPRST